MGMNISPRALERLREQYPYGTRIICLHMNDPRPIPDNTCGTVVHVDDMGTVHCRFDNGRQLGLIPYIVDFRKLTTDEDGVKNEN